MVAQEGLGEAVGWCLGVLYANDSMVISRDPDWMQHSMNMLVGLFLQYGLAANITRSHSMT